MRRLVKILLSVFFFYLAYGVFLSRVDIKIIPTELVAENPKGFHDYRGVVNVQTALSTGGGSLKQVIQSAQDAELDFLFITDLNVYNPPTESEGYHNNLLVFVGSKYSYLNSRIMVLDATTEAMKSAGQAQVVLTDLVSQPNRAKQSGIAVLAHPLKPGFAWNGPIPDGIDGLEIINLKLMWQNAWLNQRLSFLWTLLIWPFNERLAFLRLLENPYRELELWDQLGTKRKVIGFAGSDAEAQQHLLGSFSFSFPSYKTLFGLVNNHVLLTSELTGQVSSDRLKIGSALRDGRFYMSVDTLANPKGFSAVISDSDGRITPMGSEIKFRDGLELIVEVPIKPDVPMDVIITRDGERLMTSNSKLTRMPLHSPGVYRAMVRVIPLFPLPDGRKWIPWIYSNPFYVRAGAKH